MHTLTTNEQIGHLNCESSEMGSFGKVLEMTVRSMLGNTLCAYPCLYHKDKYTNTDRVIVLK